MKKSKDKNQQAPRLQEQPGLVSPAFFCAFSPKTSRTAVRIRMNTMRSMAQSWTSHRENSGQGSPHRVEDSVCVPIRKWTNLTGHDGCFGSLDSCSSRFHHRAEHYRKLLRETKDWRGLGRRSTFSCGNSGGGKYNNLYSNNRKLSTTPAQRLTCNQLISAALTPPHGAVGGASKQCWLCIHLEEGSSSPFPPSSGPTLIARPIRGLEETQRFPSRHSPRKVSEVRL